MDGLQDGAEPRRDASAGPRRIARPRAEFVRAGGRPWSEMTIRDLIIELGRVEDALGSRATADDRDGPRRYLTRREALILEELHRRRSPDPSPGVSGESAAAASA